MDQEEMTHEKLYMEVMSTDHDSKLVQLLTAEAKLLDTDKEAPRSTIILLRYAASAINARCAAVAWLRNRIRELQRIPS